MNPFIVILICIPLAVALLGEIVAIYGIFHGGQDSIPAIILFTTLSGVLIYLLFRASRSPYLEFEGDDRLPPRSRALATNFVMIIAYVVLAAGLFAVIRPDSIRYWVGLVTSIMASFMIYLALAELGVRQYIFARRLSKSLIVAFLLAAAFSWPAFERFSLDRYVSTFDLFGIIFLLTSTAFWLFRTTIRDKQD
jgi:hypothetical protein